MKKKMTYEAPVAEQMEVRIERNIMSIEAPANHNGVQTFGDDIDYTW